MVRRKTKAKLHKHSRGLPAAEPNAAIAVPEAPSATPKTTASVPKAAPDHYFLKSGQGWLVLLPVNPFLVHAYWVIPAGPPHGEKESPWRLPAAQEAVLRFHDVTPGPAAQRHPEGFFDVGIDPAPGNWYVHLWSPDKTYIAELGFRDGTGCFHPLLRSNRVSTPRAWPLSGDEGKVQWSAPARTLGISAAGGPGSERAPSTGTQAEAANGPGCGQSERIPRALQDEVARVGGGQVASAASPPEECPAQHPGRLSEAPLEPQSSSGAVKPEAAPGAGRQTTSSAGTAKEGPSSPGGLKGGPESGKPTDGLREVRSSAAASDLADLCESLFISGHSSMILISPGGGRWIRDL